MSLQGRESYGLPENIKHKATPDGKLMILACVQIHRSLKEVGINKYERRKPLVTCWLN
jgi:hypothetical protein